MSRATILIGVNRTGGLPVLEDAVRGARSMERWALSQGIPRRRVLLFTDEQGPLDVADLKRAIRSLVESGSIQQLIVYFAGHGVNIRYGEYWLLSDAPVDPAAAVNVEGSIVLARRSGIPHVVFISDACRTAAEGIQAQGITGSEIFPNDPVPGPEQAVDIFFATTLGRPALEVKDPLAASSSFRAVYTQALLDAVSGRIPAAVKVAEEAGRRLHLVQPRPLKTCLLAELPRRLVASGLSLVVGQVPDARITSDDDAWLARLENLPPPAPPAPPRVAPPAVPSAAPAALAPSATFDAELEALLRQGDQPLAAVPSAVSSAVSHTSPPTASTTASSTAPARPFDAAVVLIGAEVADCIGMPARAEMKERERGRVSVSLDTAAANLLLIIGDGSGVLVPVIRNFITTVVFDDGELAELAYEPAEGAPYWPDFRRRTDHLRELRRLVAGAARGGIFHPDARLASALTRQMRYGQLPQGQMQHGQLQHGQLPPGGLVDPALALYAAYALHDLRMIGELRELGRSLSHELSISLFDLALLTGTIREREQPLLLPPFPMLARGWALLSAAGVVLPEGLEGIQHELLPSLWTHFKPAGVSRLRDLILARRL